MTSSSAPYRLAAQTMGVSTSLMASGAIISISALGNPLLEDNPPDLSLSNLRFLFSRGSHIFPQLATVASSAFAYLAYWSPPGAVRAQYIAAAAGCISIAPFTVFVMVPAANGRLRELMKKEARDGAKGIDKAEVRELLKRFNVLNYIRGLMIATGGLLGLATALGMV